MSYRKRLILSFLTLAIIFMAGPDICYAGCDCGATECGFPFGQRPPCFYLSISGVFDCNNGPWPGWSTICGPVGTDGQYCSWFSQIPGDFTDIYADSSGMSIFSNRGAFGTVSSCVIEGSSGNMIECPDCNVYPKWCTGPNWWDCCFSHGGTATWSPIWDCDNNVLSVIVIEGKSPIHYANEDCCPSSLTGETTKVTIYSPGATCVVSGYYFVVGPNTISSSSNLAKVIAEPSGCNNGANSVTFTIQALHGKPPQTVTVEVWAQFFDDYGHHAGGSASVDVIPYCGECCAGGAASSCKVKLE